MPNLGLSVSDIVNVQIVMSPKAAMTRNFGSLLIMGTTPTIDVAERLRLYKNIEGVASDFGVKSAEYKAAASYFAQSPQPNNLYLGRWAELGAGGVLHGGALSAKEQDIAIFKAIKDGAITISVDGKAKALKAIDLSAATNLNGVASTIGTQLDAVAVVTWNQNENRFDIVSNTTGEKSTVDFAEDSPLAQAMKIVAGVGGTSTAGVAPESPVDAVAACANMSNDWYGLTFAAPITDNAKLIEVVNFIEASSNSRIFGITTQDAGVLSSTNKTDIASVLKAATVKRTFVQYSSTSPYAAASIFGRAFTVNFGGSNTTITLKFKQEPTIAPESLTESQAAVLQSKNCNVFVRYNNDTAIIQEGVMSNGYFFDEVHGTDWLQNDVQTAVFNLLYTSTTKIPQTDGGINQILTVIESRLDQAVTNGLIAAGTWNADGFGAIKRGQTLSKGYYVYAPSVALQSQADREARKAPVIQAAIKLAGAVHFVDVIINVNR